MADQMIMHRQAVRLDRMLWATFITIQLAFGAVVGYCIAHGSGPGRLDLVTPTAAAVVLALLVTGAVLASNSRRRPVGDRDDLATYRGAYSRQAFASVAVLGTACIFGLVIVLYSSDPAMAAVLPVAALLLQLKLAPRPALPAR